MFNQSGVNTAPIDNQNNQRSFSRRHTGALAAGNNTITSPANATRYLLVMRYYGSLSAAATMILQDGAGGTAIGSVNLPAAGTFNFDFSPDGVILTQGNLFNLNSSAIANIEATVVGREL